MEPAAAGEGLLMLAVVVGLSAVAVILAVLRMVGVPLRRRRTRPGRHA